MQSLALSTSEVHQTILSLATWFDKHARDVPWRHTRDPWLVWVSEVMLQQTRVETVLRHFVAFVTLFPTPDAMAMAGEDAVVQAWAGLGYYRRARLLYQGAVAITERFGGQIPVDREQLLGLPGIGPYTASSIASIAHGQAVLPIDGNVARVVARMQLAATAHRNWSQAEQDVWNQALSAAGPEVTRKAVQAMMEVGSTLCQPVQPRCPDCPITASCHLGRALQEGLLPRTNAKFYGSTRTKAPPTEEFWRALRIHNARGQTLLIRRPPGLLGLQWALPMQPADTPWPSEPHRIHQVRHVFTHRAWNVEIGVLAVCHDTDVPLLWLEEQALCWETQPESRVPSQAFRKMLRG